MSFNGAHDAVLRTLRTGCWKSLRVLVDHGVIFGQRLHLSLSFDLDDLVALGLEFSEQTWHSFGGGFVNVVQQNDALAALLQLCHHRFDDVLGRLRFKIEAVDVR